VKEGEPPTASISWSMAEARRPRSRECIECPQAGDCFGDLLYFTGPLRAAHDDRRGDRQISVIEIKAQALRPDDAVQAAFNRRPCACWVHRLDQTNLR